MHQETIIILFYLNKSKINQKGICPIKCRITFLKKRKEFSTGQFVNPDDWNSKKQLAVSNSKNNSILNAELALIKSKLEKAHLKLQLEDNDFTVDDILLKYLNKKIKKEDGVISYFKKYLARQEKLIGKDIKQATWDKFNYVCNRPEIKARQDHTQLFADSFRNLRNYCSGFSGLFWVYLKRKSRRQF